MRWSPPRYITTPSWLDLEIEIDALSPGLVPASLRVGCRCSDFKFMLDCAKVAALLVDLEFVSCDLAPATQITLARLSVCLSASSAAHRG